MNKLPVIDTFNIKRVVIEGLESKVAELGNLNVPFIFSTDYPSSATNSTNDTGDTVSYRRVIVKRLSSVPQIYGIGDIYASENNLHEVDLDGRPAFSEFASVVANGWYEDHTIEISVWCRDPNDRDNILELLRMYMLELNHRILENGAPYFYNNRVYALKFNRIYEAQDTKIIGDNVHYVGVLEYLLSAPVYGITLEEYDQIKVSIIGQIDGQGPDLPAIIIDDTPKFPPIGGPGGVNPSLPPGELYVSPVQHYSTSDGKSSETLYVGGPLKTDGGALIEHIQKQLED
jgi:hypothetical protein